MIAAPGILRETNDAPTPAYLHASCNIGPRRAKIHFPTAAGRPLVFGLGEVPLRSQWIARKSWRDGALGEAAAA